MKDALQHALDVLSGFLAENPLVGAWYTTVVRFVFPLLALMILVGAIRSLWKVKHPDEVWGYLSLGNGVRLPLTHWENIIGRGAACDVQLEYPSVSRQHAALIRENDGSWTVYDLNSKGGIKVMSANLVLENEDDPVLWRGPVVAGAIKQFWQEVVWDVDFLFVDMPPGTGDVPLTVFQTLPVDGIVIVSSPQELVGMIVGKAVQMAQMMHVPILGLVENMSYAVCPDCGKHINVFGDSHVDEIADKYKLPVLAKMPIDPELAKEADAGMIEVFAGDYLDNAAQTVAKLLKK